MGQSAQTTPGRKNAGGNVFQQSAAGLQNAGKATLAAGKGFADIAGGNGYGGVTPANSGYTAALQSNPALIKSGISSYMNPYTNDVINRTQQDVRQQTQMGLRDIGDSAGGAGAFGGSRHGIAEGTAISEGSRAVGDISAQLRSQGFDTAAGLAGQDIQNRMGAAGANQAAINAARQYSAGARTSTASEAIRNRLAALSGLQSTGAQGAALSGQALDVGQGLSGQEAAYGGQVQQIPQSLISQAAGMFDRYTGQPLESTAAILNMLSGNPLSGAAKTTQTNTPGTKSMLSGALGLAARV